MDNKFASLPAHMQTERWIQSEIDYESKDGVHTYSMCDCGRSLCRDKMCVVCWKEVLESLKASDALLERSIVDERNGIPRHSAKEVFDRYRKGKK